MAISEKRVESRLDTLLKSNGFHSQYIFYSPHENPILKEIFKSASKSGNGGGIPDRIYFDGTTLIIVECKTADMTCAIRDLQLYASKINCEYRLFFVAYCLDSYRIFTSEFKELNQKLTPTTFNLNPSLPYSKETMERDIHKIHNYIRDYTKISNEDKSFFIASILIALKKASFRSIIKNYDTKEYIYDLIKQNLTDYDIDVSVFEFLRHDENNKYLLDIVTMVLHVYDQHPTTDLLNSFYSEFVKYSNTDSKSLGIVLTPHHIISLMIDLLEINDKDVFLDLCSGTGSFAMEANRHHPTNIICCEYQNKLFTLLKCNMILRDCKGVFIKDNCFQQDFTQYNPTKSAINPPYGMKGTETELAFVLKQLESLTEGGLACAIIPCSKLSKTPERNKLLQYKIHKIIPCSKDLFYPTASVKTCIILIEKTHMTMDKQHVQFIEYDDGFTMRRGTGRIKDKDATFQISTRMISADDETWINQTISTNINNIDLKLRLIETEYHASRIQCINNMTHQPHITTRFKSFLISELFTIQKAPAIPYTQNKLVFEIAARNNNNGIKRIVPSNANTFTGNKIVLITGGDGGAGLAFYQEHDFNITSSTVVLAPNDTIRLDTKIGIYVATELSKYKQKYSRGFQWNTTRIKSDTIDLPIDEDEHIDYEYMYQQFL